MTTNIYFTPDYLPITGKLASHFSADEISAAEVRSEYERANHILDNPSKFPKADVETLTWLAEALFNLSPLAVFEGLPPSTHPTL